MLITPSTVIDSSRILTFNCLIFCYLKQGQHRIAADNLTNFVKTHRYLNKYEISAIDSAYKDTLEGLNESVGFIQNSHQEIEGIGLQIIDSGISQTHRQDLQLRLESATAKLQYRQKTFDTIVQGVGFIRALSEHHQKLSSEYQLKASEVS